MADISSLLVIRDVARPQTAVLQNWSLNASIAPWWRVPLCQNKSSNLTSNECFPSYLIPQLRFWLQQLNMAAAVSQVSLLRFVQCSDWQLGHVMQQHHLKLSASRAREFVEDYNASNWMLLQEAANSEPWMWHKCLTKDLHNQHRFNVDIVVTFDHQIQIISSLSLNLKKIHKSVCFMQHNVLESIVVPTMKSHSCSIS